VAAVLHFNHVNPVNPVSKFQSRPGPTQETGRCNVNDVPSERSRNGISDRIYKINRMRMAGRAVLCRLAKKVAAVLHFNHVNPVNPVSKFQSRPGPTQETGRCNVNDVPSPGADCTVTLPPSARRVRSTRHSPSPAPLVVAAIALCPR